ncbi:proliferating cell nuclear antigen (pcna) [Candidatus Micrarchaeota archaeon]|nr:proliferating cell nuclear antigen (pcna) [Candidatus Micrarchaeota archaeon]
MELVVEDAKFFKSCIDAIVNLVDEGTFEISNEGMKLRTMDPSQIAMIDFILPKEAFSKLEIEGKTNLCVNLVDLSKVLARTRSEESLSIKLDERESRLLLEFKGESKRHFKLPLLETNASLPREPKIAFDAVAKLKGGAFKAMLHDAGLLSSHVVLQADDGEFVIEAHGDSGDLRIETKKDSNSLTDLKVTTKARAMFPFEYLDDITRACPEDSIVELHLKSEAPVKTVYEIGKAKLAYYLAPRVETA